MAQFGRFGRYWWENVKSSKEASDLIILIASVVLVGVSIFGRLANVTNPTLIFISNPLVGTVLFLFWLLVVTPFRRYERQQRELQMLKPQMPTLEIGTDSHQGERSRNGKCRIQVRNKSEDLVAQGVTVKLLSSSLPVKRLLSLQPEEKDGNVIHPQVPSYFDFFTVERTDCGYILRVTLVGYEPQVTFDPKLISRQGEKPLKYQEYNLQIGAYVSQSPSPVTSKTFKLTFSGDLREPAFTLSEINEAAPLTPNSIA